MQGDGSKPQATSPAKTLQGSWLRELYSLLVGLSGLAALAYLLATGEQELTWPPVVLFAVLSVLVQRSSFHLGSPITHSLVGVIDVAAVLALGPAGGALVAVLSGVSYLELSALHHRRLTSRYLVEMPLFNAGLKSWISLLGGVAYLRLGGSLPLLKVDLPTALAVCAFAVAWFVGDHVGWGIYDLMDGGCAWLWEVVIAHRHRSAGELAAAISETVAVFVGDAPRFDDFTLVVAKRQAQGSFW